MIYNNTYFYLLKTKLTKINYYIYNIFLIFLKHFNISYFGTLEHKITFIKNKYKLFKLSHIKYLYKTNILNNNNYQTIKYCYNLKQYLHKNLHYLKHLIKLTNILVKKFVIIVKNPLLLNYIYNIIKLNCNNISIKVCDNNIDHDNNIKDKEYNYITNKLTDIKNLYKNYLIHLYVYTDDKMSKIFIKNLLYNTLHNNIDNIYINNIIYIYNIYNIINNNNIINILLQYIYNIKSLYNIYYTSNIKNNIFTNIKINIKNISIINNLFNIFENKNIRQNIIYTFYNSLTKFIFGQNKIIKKILHYITRIDTKKSNKPIASWLLCGPSGTGKTELVKIIAEYLYKSNKNLIHLDMSEYKESHSVSKLIGSPPGYVGHDKGGNLVTKICENSHSVILFDEIEKANKNIYPIFLQILDDGILTDSRGVSCYLNNNIIVFTSNLGSDIFKDASKTKIYSSKYYNQVKNSINSYFKPEFLNRLDDIIIFNPLLSDFLYSIIEKFNIHNKNIYIDHNIKSLLSIISYSPVRGSRFLLNNLYKFLLNIVNSNNITISYNDKFIKYIIL